MIDCKSELLSVKEFNISFNPFFKKIAQLLINPVILWRINKSLFNEIVARGRRFDINSQPFQEEIEINFDYD